MYDKTFEIKIRNHGGEPVKVLVYEHMWRWNDGENVMANAEWEKIDETTVKFSVRVKKDKEKVIKYIIRYNWQGDKLHKL